METKTILLTGATDGIGLATARRLAAEGHTVLLHGRNKAKLDAVAEELIALKGGAIESYEADLSRLSDVEELARSVAANHDTLDVLINNAGVYVTRETASPDGLDIRFVVNTIAPYLLTRRLLPLLSDTGRVVNLSSAAQAPLEPQDLTMPSKQSDSFVYAQSKLALTMWSVHMAAELGENGPVVVAINPKSMLGTKMVKQAYGVAGHDMNIGADILCRAALSDEFADATGKYFDNDIERFASPHPDALNPARCRKIVAAIESVLNETTR